MQLKLVRPFLSVVSLPPQDLPDFTVITGVNGAGKSHLLKALQDGSVVCDAAPNTRQDVRLFDWTTLYPQDEGDFASETIRNEQAQLFEHLKHFYEQPWGFKQLFTRARAEGITGRLLTDAHALATASSEELSASSDNLKNGAEIKANIDEAVRELTQNIEGNLQADNREKIQQVAEASGRSIIALRRDDFLRTLKPNWGRAELFQQSFARLFVAYRDLAVYNRLAKLAIDEGRKDVKAYSKAEFEREYGEPPWDFVNKSLAAARLDFTIDSPDEFSLSPYRPRLHKQGTVAEIFFDSLSSGERVLMSFAFAVYYASDVRQDISRPKLLLLDEVDAPLHPSMSKSLLSTIQQVLVRGYGLKVILTTHSPSTVALSPEDAIHVMRPGVPGLHKRTKDAAIADLTAGVPTLSIFYEGRRQVFVESPKDVEVYQSAFDALREWINSDVSAVFIATGVESATGQHVNTGCVVVKRIVAEMRAAGAKHTLGLVDWDGENASGDGLIVLAEGVRDGLESVMFDPLLLLNTLVRHLGTKTDRFQLPTGTTYISLLDVPADRLQIAVDEIQRRVLGRSRDKIVTVNYVGGLTLEVDAEFLTMDDHELEQKVYCAFPQLHAISRSRVGELTKWIARTVLAERPEHAPACLLESLSRVCAS